MGLEVHAELSTKSKVFCGCSTEFGAPPNSQVCPVCLGLPGVLPVLNRQVVEYALRVAVAMNCEIVSPSIFERKNYYYPDLPKNYQISQKRHPLARNGYIEIPVNGDGSGWGFSMFTLRRMLANWFIPRKKVPPAPAWWILTGRGSLY